MAHQHWSDDYQDMEELARRLEEVFRQASVTVLRASGVSAEKMVDAMIDLQASILRFDDFAKKGLWQAAEDKQVRRLAADNVFLGAVLTSAVALSEYKKAPRNVSQPDSKAVRQLRRLSTTVPSLFLLSSATIHGLLGRSLLRRARQFSLRGTVSTGIGSLQHHLTALVRRQKS